MLEILCPCIYFVCTSQVYTLSGLRIKSFDICYNLVNIFSQQDLSGLASTSHAPQHKEVSPSLLHSPSTYTFPSSALQGMKWRFTGHSYLFVRFLSSLGLSNPFSVSSTHKSCIQFRLKLGYTSQQTTRRHNNTGSTL